jgi:hypothetical protein
MCDHRVLAEQEDRRLAGGDRSQGGWRALVPPGESKVDVRDATLSTMRGFTLMPADPSMDKPLAFTLAFADGVKLWM